MSIIITYNNGSLYANSRVVEVVRGTGQVAEILLEDSISKIKLNLEEVYSIYIDGIKV